MKASKKPEYMDIAIESAMSGETGLGRLPENSIAGEF
jgi:hypothetical protein